MNVVKSSPFSSRTKSLRERFGSKRSYSENFKDPPVPSTKIEKDSAGRNVRPSMPNIGLPASEGGLSVQEAMMQHLQQQHQQQQQIQQLQKKQQMNVLSEHYNPFAALPEETYCSALDINSQQGDDPRFPWQRDAAVQCDMSPNGEGYRFARKDSFFMMSRDVSSKLPEEAKSEANVLDSTQLSSFSAASPAPATTSESSGMSIAERFREVYWPNLSICNEEDESPVVPEAKEEKKKKKTSMLQRALSERCRNRRLMSQMSVDESKPLVTASETVRHLLSQHHNFNAEENTSSSADGAPTVRSSLREGNFNSAPVSRTETPPSDNSPQTPPSRRNSRKMKFVRKQTNSAPDSFDNDEPLTPPPAHVPPTIPTITHTPDISVSDHHERTGLSVGYFNFDSMQRLLDLSMTASSKLEKPTLLLTPGGLTVGKDKSGSYMTLPSPNVQNGDEQEGPPNVFKKLSSVEDEDSEHEEADHAPPASALHRRRALVPPKMLTDGYESATDETDQHSPNGTSPQSSEASGQSRRRRSSIVVIPPMQICPGDLLVYSKVLTQRNTLLDIDGSTQSLSVNEADTTRKTKNSWSLLRLFDRSSRSKSESLCGLEEVLSSLQPSEFIDEHLSKYKGMSWTEFVSLWEGRTKREHKSLLIQNAKWLNFNSSSTESKASPRVSVSSGLTPPSSTASTVKSGSLGDSPSTNSSWELESNKSHLSLTRLESKSKDSQSLSSPVSPFNYDSPQGNNDSVFEDATRPDNGCTSALEEIEHQIHTIGAQTRTRNALKRKEALWDLFQSECMFLYDHLMVLKNVFMEPLKKIQVEGFAMFAEPEVLFGNLDELCCVTYSFCKEFLSLILQKMSGDEIDTTEVLVRLFQKSMKANALTQAYHRYTLNYINALNYLETLRRQVEFNEFEKWCSRDIRCKKLQLTDLLVSPVQHVMRVPLLLKEIEMRTEIFKEKQLITIIIESEENSLRELDDKMKWLKNFERLLEIQRSIVWPSVSELDPKAFIPDFLKQPLAKQPCERLIVSPRRQIVLEGSLHLLDSGKPSETFVLLFDDMLLITRRKKGLHKKKSSITENWASTCNKSSSSHESGYKYVVYKQPLSLDRFFIHDVSQQDGAANNLKNAFVLVCLNRFQQIVTVHTFQAPNEAVKNLWLSKLKDTMDRWKRTLQNTVFRNQRATSTSSTDTPHIGTTVVK